MSVVLTWEQIALRILLATIASFAIGYNRDERGKSLGIRTTMLVCLAATLAMLQANQLMNTTGKAPNSFVNLDLMRLPLGILSGIGFIGAGAILRKDGLIHGVTTAATIWFVTVLGLLFGGGQLILATFSTGLALFILWVLKRVESHIPTLHTGSLSMEFATPEAPTMAERPTEEELRRRLRSSGFEIRTWTVHYRESELASLECELRWPQKDRMHPDTPKVLRELAAVPSVSALCWRD
jgi:putative Mg2+ transporter-C (MgtC) family protein